MPVFFIFFISVFSFVSIAQSYQSQDIVAMPFEQSINKTGRLAFKRTLDLSFKTTGYLKVLTVDEGEYFSSGDTLAALETTELLATKNATYATLLKAKRNVHRVSELIIKELSSAQALESAKTDVETARAAYKSAFYNLEKAQIIAPFSGQVVKRFTDVGELQSPANTILSIAALENNWIVKVALTESEVSLLSLAQSVNVRLNNATSVNGVISKIPATANTETQLFDVEIQLPSVNKNTRLIAGQLAQVSMNTTTDDYVFEIPIDALVRVDDQDNAVLVVLNQEDKPVHQAFPIYRLNNQSLFVTAPSTDNVITVVTHGWHNVN